MQQFMMHIRSSMDDNECCLSSEHRTSMIFISHPLFFLFQMRRMEEHKEANVVYHKKN